jgi:hypothetical protein
MLGIRMSKYALCLCCLFLVGLLAPASAYTAGHTGTAQKQHIIVEKFIELFNHEDVNISLGAMLVSIDIKDYMNLEKYIRNIIKEDDEKWITCVKLFVISRYTFEDNDAINFIKSIPDDRKNFQKLIEFESSILRHPGSHILSHLIYYTDNKLKKPIIREIANTKIKNILPLSDGWVGDFLDSRIGTVGLDTMLSEPAAVLSAKQGFTRPPTPEEFIRAFYAWYFEAEKNGGVALNNDAIFKYVAKDAVEFARYTKDFEYFTKMADSYYLPVQNVRIKNVQYISGDTSIAHVVFTVCQDIDDTHVVIFIKKYSDSYLILRVVDMYPY